MKTLADEEVETVKLIILGINRAGENLISFANDLVNRIDIIPFEANPDEKVDSLIGQGEHALNIRLNVRQEIVREAKGSFYLAQMLAREVCMEASVLERRDSPRPLRGQSSCGPFQGLGTARPILSSTLRELLHKNTVTERGTGAVSAYLELVGYLK
jgi:hypothetical protein